MSKRWLLAKYVEDVRRREPRNVGVILLEDEHFMCRFIGEQGDGVIDGRQLRFLNSAAAYKQWVKYWKRQATADQLVSLVGSPEGHNYYLEFGGEILLGGNGVEAVDLIDELYAELVDDTLDARAEDVRRLSDQVINPVEHRLPNPIEREALLSVHHEGVTDELTFDYRYNNGVPHLMQRVSLTMEGTRSWDRVHATAWTFQQVHNSDDDALRQANLIALYKPRDDDARELNKQLRQLERNAHVIDVTDQEEAQRQLLEVLGQS